MSRRSWLAAAALAISACYFSTLLPLVVGPLRNSAGAVASYVRTIPILPGLGPGALLTQTLDVPLPVAAGIFTALIVLTMLVDARQRHLDDVLAVAAVLALLVGAESFFLSIALRA